MRFRFPESRPRCLRHIYPLPGLVVATLFWVHTGRRQVPPTILHGAGPERNITTSIRSHRSINLPRGVGSIELATRTHLHVGMGALQIESRLGTDPIFSSWKSRFSSSVSVAYLASKLKININPHRNLDKGWSQGLITMAARLNTRTRIIYDA